MNGRNEVVRLKRRLDGAFTRAPSSSSEIELQSDFARYLCILVSGYLENAIVALVLDYVQRRSGPEVTSFVDAQLNRWTNANAEKIFSLLGSFDPEWRRRAETRCCRQPRRRSHWCPMLSSLPLGRPKR